MRRKTTKILWAAIIGLIAAGYIYLTWQDVVAWQWWLRVFAIALLLFLVKVMNNQEKRNNTE